MEIVIALFIFAGLVFVLPLMGTLFGAFSGWVVSLVFGGWVTSGLLALGFNIQPDQLYLVGAALGFVGGFFKTTVSKSSK